MDEGLAGGSLGEVGLALESGLSAGLPDRDLVARFAGGGEGADSAFAVLVHRHGAMVWRLCRRVAGEPEDAADAFQATFLVLIRRAGTVQVGDSLAPWLHGVGRRVAHRARGRAARHRRREQTNQETTMTQSSAADARADAPDADLRAVLDAELARLPRANREALAACYLDGLTHEGAAAALGCPVGTVRSRLARGRDLLRGRLARRGLGGSGASLPALLAESTVAPMPPGLLAATARLARSVDLARPSVVALAGAVARALGGGRWVRLVAPVAGVLLVSGVVWAFAVPGPQPRPADDDPAAPLPPITAEVLAARVRESLARPKIGLLVAEYQDERLDRDVEFSLIMASISLPPNFDNEVIPPDDAVPVPPRLDGEVLRPLPLPAPPFPLPPPPPALKRAQGVEPGLTPGAEATLRQLAPPKPKPKPIRFERGPGRFTYRTDGRRWRAEHDGVNLGFGNFGGEPLPERWVAGFDGVVHYETRDGGMTVELGTTKPEAEAEAPARLFWDGAAAAAPPAPQGPGFRLDLRVHHGFQTSRMTEHLAPLDTALLAEAEVGQRVVDGYRCYTLAVADPNRSYKRVEAVISPRQSMLPLAVRTLERGRVEHSFAASEPRQLADGQWYPGRIVVEEWIVPTEATAEPTLKSRRDLRIVRCEPIAASPAAANLTLAVPPNSKVIDHRTGQSYLNDPWWPEFHRYLTHEQGWPDLNPAPCERLQSPRAELDGRDAPPLAVSDWLLGEPIDATLRDRAATLLVFPIPGDPTLVPMLRRLTAADPSRLRVVTVVPRVADHTVATGREFLGEFRWPGPVAWDGPLRFEYGPTCAAYGIGDVRQLPAAYLITPEGKVRTIAQGTWLAAINTQIAALGGRPLAFPPTESIGFGLRFRRLVRAWWAWAPAAPATARLTGTVVDPAGRPLAGAEVRLKLKADVATRIDATFTGGWTLQGLSLDRGQKATTDAAGRFVVDRLCKGNYAVAASAPGRAAAEVTATLAEGQASADCRIVLPGDGLAGVIRDESGAPVAGAVVEVFNHHTRTANGGTNYGLSALAPKHTATADGAGHYRCGPLTDGLYSVRVTAPGYTEEVRYEVATGAEGIEFALKRAASPADSAVPR